MTAMRTGIAYFAGAGAAADASACADAHSSNDVVDNSAPGPGVSSSPWSSVPK
jgi:hypothetical protein